MRGDMTNSRLLTIAASVSLLIVAVAISISLVMHTSHNPVASQAVSPSATTSVQPSPATSEQKQLTIADFVASLSAHGLPIEKKSEKFYGMIMANDGMGLTIAGDEIEVYQFDTSITSGQDALENLKKTGLMGQKVMVNRNLLIVPDPKHPKWAQIEAVFSGL